MTPRPRLFSLRCCAYVVFWVVLSCVVIHRLTQPLWDEPEVVVEIGSTYDDLRRNSSAPFSSQIRGHIWFGIPKTDARLRFVDPQFGFITPAARFFTVDFDDNVIWGIRMSPQIEPLLLDDALKVALDLQDQWRRGGWRLAGRRSYPPFEDTPEWREQFRDVNRGGAVYWKADKKYQVTMFMHRFKYEKRPNEERYLITLSIGKPWTPFEEDGDYAVDPDPADSIIPQLPTGKRSLPCQAPSS